MAEFPPVAPLSLHASTLGFRAFPHRQLANRHSTTKGLHKSTKSQHSLLRKPELAPPHCSTHLDATANPQRLAPPPALAPPEQHPHLHPGLHLPRRSLFLGVSSLVLAPAASTLAAEDGQRVKDTNAGFRAEEKTKNLPLDTLKEIIASDIRDRQYFVTGKMTKSIYRDDCFFIDPMNQVTGVDNYILGISLFLDPSCAYNELLGISAMEPNVIEAIWGLSGYFRYVPWQPYLSPIVGGTKYVLDEEGLVKRHEETWSISNAEAWRITLTPAFAEKGKTCKQYEGKTLPM